MHDRRLVALPVAMWKDVGRTFSLLTICLLFAVPLQ